MFVCFEFIISYNGRGKEKCLQRRNAGSQALYLKSEKERPNILLLPLPNLLHSMSVTPSTVQPMVTRPEIWTCLSAQ